MRRAAMEERGDLSDADGAKGGWKKTPKELPGVLFTSLVLDGEFR